MSAVLTKNMTELALTVASKYPVFALRADKSPATTNGFHAATQDAEIIRGQFADPAAALIGVPTGAPSGLFVLDVDPDGLAWLETNRRRLPTTRAQKTRRGGYHFLLRMPAGDVRCSAGKIAPGVDVRANGGYIVWWRAEGLDVEDADLLADVPEWLLKAATAGSALVPVANGPFANDRARCNLTMEQLRGLAEYVDVDAYDPWLRLGQALHHETEGSDEGLAIWIAASRNSDKYREGECAAKWAGFGRNNGPPITMRHVINVAKLQGAPRELWAAARGQAARDLELRMANGRTISDEENIGRILERDPALVGLALWDEFRSERIITRPVPGSDGDLSVVVERGMPRPWTDADTVELQKYIQRRYMPRIGRERIEGPLDSHARRHGAFHPVRDYLQGLEWDGNPRLDTLLRDCFAATAQSEYLAAVGSKFLIAAVARILTPGCQADSALVLEGRQGYGKSTGLRILAGDEWFSDSLPADLSHKDARDHLRGKWILELSELSQFKRAEIETIKAFLSRRHESYRPSYGRHEVQFPRQCVFAGTTNSSEYLQDTTGNRRFWVVACGRVQLAALRKHRNQLWAEAVHRYRQHEPWHLPFSLEEVAARETQSRIAHDPWTTDVVVALRAMGEPRTVSPGEVMSRMALSTESRHGRNAGRIGQILLDLGWKRGQKDRTRGRLFERPAGQPTAAAHSEVTL
jgi:predicted P-loop ATPase